MRDLALAAASAVASLNLSYTLLSSLVCNPRGFVCLFCFAHGFLTSQVVSRQYVIDNIRTTSGCTCHLRSASRFQVLGASLPMPHSLPLLNKTITLQEALDEDDDVLQQLSYPEKRLDFFYYLFQHRKEIEAIVSFHLGITNDTCKVAEDFREWVHGSFNACIPVYIDHSVKFHAKKVFIRFPLPYEVGEPLHSGNAEEKLRREIAIYIWIQSNCPEVQIPCLRGFGFPGGRTVCG